MNIYQSIKDFGKKALVVGGLVAVLSGCNQGVNQVLIDINRDGKKDVVNYMSDFWGSSDIYLSLNQNGSFTESKKIIHLQRRPIELQVEDLNGDGNLDISYVMSDFYGSWDMYLAKGNGDGTFQNPVKIKHYQNRPQ